MAERITAVAMQAFRGVPSTFNIDLPNGCSYVALGDNGTGKSTIADALEWYFRGQIELLTKEGRSDAVRHTGADPEFETAVTIATDGILGGEITDSELSPPAARVVGRSELFLLRGRTLAEFVDKPKGEKWDTLAGLLGLESINQMRLDLQRARNELENAAQSSRSDLAQKRAALSERVAEVSDAGVLAAMRKSCAAAGVEPPGTLEETLDPQWVKTIAPAQPSGQLAVALQTILTNLRTIADHAVTLEPVVAWNEFVKEGQQADQFRLGLHKAADSLLKSGNVEPDHCPLCGQQVDSDVLAHRIADELQALDGATRSLEAARQGVRQIINALRDEHQRRLNLVDQPARAQGIKLAELPVSRADALPPQIDAVAVIDQARVEKYQSELRTWDALARSAVEAAIPLPATARDRALVEIGVLHTEASAWRRAVVRDREAIDASKLANEVFTRYQQRQGEHFRNVVQQISDRTAEIYQFLHPEVGVSAVAVETVGEKGAELSVEFHGRKELPPHRVLSESHMNSLCVALFLAMAETFNERLGFVVLDDVVNSFDREHRGRLADLLVDQFEDIQLIVLTHDEQFYTRLCRRAPSWAQDHFTSWTYQGGPRRKRYQGDRLLEESREALVKGDRIGAAQKGRRALEEFLQEACEALEALLPFRRGQRNDQRMVEEVMNGLRRVLRDRARSFYEEIAPLLAQLEADIQAALNVETHANQGGTSNQEVSDAIERLSTLRGHFSCGRCGTRVWHEGSPEAFRCKCGLSQFPSPTSLRRDN